nr:unnamed protein product [Callosobruchus analis]
MIEMCSHFLNNLVPPNIKKIELIFPIPGHSFLLVFGRIEKVLKKEATIINPSTYNEIFKMHGTVKILGRDCTVKDYKQETEKYFKTVGSWHFKFSEVKRFIVIKT